MMRTRLVWFSLGLTFASAAIGQFVFKDLYFHSYTLAHQLKERFNSLDARVSHLESVMSTKPSPSEDETNLG